MIDKALYWREWRRNKTEEEKEAIRAKERARYKKNKSKILLQKKQKYRVKRIRQEAKRASNRRYHHRNKEKCNAISLGWYYRKKLENPALNKGHVYG